MANTNVAELKRSNLQEQDTAQEGLESEETRQQRELDKAFAEFEELEKSGVKTDDQILELRTDLEGDINNRIDQLESKLVELGVPPLSAEAKGKILGNDVDGAVGLETRKAQRHAALLEVLSAAGKITEGKDVLAESLETDPRLKDIQDKMIKEWELANGKPILSFEGQNFMFGDVAAYGRGEKTVTLYQKAREEFARQFPSEAKMYAEKESVRIYSDPNEDPAIRKVKEEIDDNVAKEIGRILSGKSDPLSFREAKIDLGDTRERAHIYAQMQAYKKFIEQYPEKAKAYAVTIEPIARALRNKQEKEAGQRRQAARRAAAQEAETAPTQSTTETDESINEIEVPDAEELKDENYLSGETIGLKDFNEGEDLGVVMVEDKAVIGHLGGESDRGWAPSTESREALVEKMAQDLRENPTAQEDAAGFELKAEKQSAPKDSQVNLRRVDGPEGPIFFVKDGADRVAASKLAEMSEMLARVEHAKEPDQITTTKRERAYEWKQMIERGLMEGQVDGPKDGEFSLNIKKQVLPWCSAERKDFFVANTAYDRVYPEAFDKIKSLKKPNKEIPREVFLDKTGEALNKYLYEPDKLGKYIESLKKDNK